MVALWGRNCARRAAGPVEMMRFVRVSAPGAAYGLSLPEVLEIASHPKSLLLVLKNAVPSRANSAPPESKLDHRGGFAHPTAEAGLQSVGRFSRAYRQPASVSTLLVFVGAEERTCSLKSALVPFPLVCPPHRSPVAVRAASGQFWPWSLGAL